MHAWSQTTDSLSYVSACEKQMGDVLTYSCCMQMCDLFMCVALRSSGLVGLGVLHAARGVRSMSAVCAPMATT